MADEIDALKRDKNVLMLELVRLRQQQQVRPQQQQGMQEGAVCAVELAGVVVDVLHCSRLLAVCSFHLSTIMPTAWL